MKIFSSQEMHPSVGSLIKAVALCDVVVPPMSSSLNGYRTNSNTDLLVETHL